MAGFFMNMVGQQGGDAGPPGAPLLWLDAADDATFTLNGSDVATWTCKGSGAFVFAPAGGHGAPERITDGVSFVATSTTVPSSMEVLQSTTAGATTILHPINRTIYVVAEDVSFFDVSSGVMLAVGNPFAGTANYSMFSARKAISGVQEGPWYWERGGTNSAYWAHQVATMTGVLSLAIAKKDAAGLRHAAHNSAAFTSGGGTAYVPSGLDRCYLGNERVADGTYPSNPFNGIIREILVYDSPLSGADDTAVRDYLNAKWSIY